MLLHTEALFFQELLNTMDHATLVDLFRLFDVGFYFTHGLHLNKNDKVFVCDSLAELISLMHDSQVGVACASFHRGLCGAPQQYFDRDRTGNFLIDSSVDRSEKQT